MTAAPRWLRFTAGGLEAMVPAASVRRTVPAPDPLPASVEIGGEPYPVVDLAAVAGTPLGAQPASLLLVVEAEEARLAIPATAVGGLVAPAPELVEPLPWPYDAEAGWCAGVMVPEGAGDRPVLVVELAALPVAVAAGGGVR